MSVYGLKTTTTTTTTTTHTHTHTQKKKKAHILSGQDTETPVTELRISDIPISCADADLESAIVKLGCVMRSKVIQEKK